MDSAIAPHEAPATAAAAKVLDAVRALAAVAWDEVDNVELPELTVAVAQATAMLDGCLVELAGRLDSCEVTDRLGWASPKDFLTHVTGGHKGSGGGLVRTARQLHDLPSVRAGMLAGEVSLSQARTIGSKVATLPHDDGFRTQVADRLLGLVDSHGHDASDLRTAFETVVTELDPEGATRDLERERRGAERAAHQARFLSFAPDQYGGIRIRGHCSVEDSETIKSALMPLAAPIVGEPGACGGRQAPPGAPPLHYPDGRPTRTPCPQIGCAHDGSDPRDHGVRFFDALVEACQRLQAADLAPQSHGTAARIIVTIDHHDLREELVEAGLARPGQLPDDSRLSAASTRRLACDAEIIPAVLGSESQILDVGRTHRLVTPAIWSALVLRDRHCSFPGCTRLPLACDAHHIVHWADGGPTSLDNLALLCRKHHTLAHRTPWKIRLDPQTRRPVWIRPPRAKPDLGPVIAPQRSSPLVA